MGRKKHQRRKRPWEFKKKLAAWAALIATGTVIASYVLAALDKQTNSDLAIAIFGACIGYLISYAAATVSEKVSRNRHGLDVDGNPITPGAAQADVDDRPKNNL